MECVECDRIAKNGDSAEFFIEAANMAEKINTAGSFYFNSESIKYIEKAIDCYIKSNKISYAAKANKKIA
jgi:hypothetical protein